MGLWPGGIRTDVGCRIFWHLDRWTAWEGWGDGGWWIPSNGRRNSLTEVNGIGESGGGEADRGGSESGGGEAAGEGGGIGGGVVGEGLGGEGGERGKEEREKGRGRGWLG